MAGGIGSRFWPMSTPEYPKHVVSNFEPSNFGKVNSPVLGNKKAFIYLCVDQNIKDNEC